MTNDVEDFFAANSLLMLEKCLSVALPIVGIFYSGGIFCLRMSQLCKNCKNKGKQVRLSIQDRPVSGDRLVGEN